METTHMPRLGENPRVLLMGARRAGKSSIQKVVFHKMSPHETLFLESTNKIVKNDIANSSFVQFEVWDFPGHVDTASAAVKPELTFGGCGALVWVIDAQDDYSEALSRLQATIVVAHRINPAVVFEVFLHKVDSFTEDQRIECQRDVQSHLADEMATARLSQVKINFHLTSIYDHSVFEAFSKVVQQLVPQLPTLEKLLDILVTGCRIEKAFLFDVVSKIYLATDSSPVDMQSYELCADMIDVITDVSCIYGRDVEEEDAALVPVTGAPLADSNCVISLNNGTVLILRGVNRSLALVCILKAQVLAQQACTSPHCRVLAQFGPNCLANQVGPLSRARESLNTTSVASGMRSASSFSCLQQHPRQSTATSAKLYSHVYRN